MAAFVSSLNVLLESLRNTWRVEDKEVVNLQSATLLVNDLFQMYFLDIFPFLYSNIVNRR